MNKNLFFIVLIITSTIINGHYKNAYVNQLKSLRTDQLASGLVSNLTVRDFDSLVNYGIGLLADTSRKDSLLKGKVILALTANAINDKIEAGLFDYYSTDTKTVILKLRVYHFIVYPPKMSALLKTANHLCNDDYQFLFRRLLGWKYFPGCIILTALFILSLIICLFTIRSSKTKRQLCLSLAGLSIFLIFLFFVFKATCHKYVNENSFYGMHI